VVPNSSTTTMSVLINAGDGTFHSRVTYSTSTTPGSITLADINGDNILDIVATLSSSVGIYLNTGNGTFLSEINYSTDNGPHYSEVADLNGDNKPDIVVTNYGAATIGVLLHV